jgi:hypothetical protein
MHQVTVILFCGLRITSGGYRMILSLNRRNHPIAAFLLGAIKRIVNGF